MPRAGGRPRAAAALEYDPAAGGAPRLVAKGRGAVAERILALARERGIATREDPLLAEALIKLDLLQEIPPELYQAVAEVIAFLYRLTGGGGLEGRDAEPRRQGRPGRAAG